MSQNRTSSLAALRNRDFRFYWMGLIVSAAGTWMQIVAQSLLVLRLSHGRAVSLGYVALAQALAFLLFALLGGAVADRMDRRRLLMLTQSLLMIVAFVVGLLVARHTVQIWMIVAAAFLSGTVLSFDQPARNALLSSLVEERDLMSAISLQSMVFMGAAAFGPVLAGLSIGSLGLAGCFFLNAGSYLAVILALARLRRPAHPVDPGRSPAGILAAIRNLGDVVRGDAALIRVVSGYALLLFAAPSMQLLLPVLVERVLHSNAMALGLLFASFGAGTAGGGVMVAQLAIRLPVEKLYLGSCILWVAAMAIIALADTAWVYFGALLFVGAAQSAIGVLTVTVMQSRVERQMRGRVMSLQTMLNMSLRPLGDFPISVLITSWGAPAVAGVSAMVLGGFSLFLVSLRGFGGRSK